MTLGLDNMTQAEFDEVMAEIKARNPNLFQFITDFVDKKSKHRRGGRLPEDETRRPSGIYQELSSEGIT